MIAFVSPLVLQTLINLFTVQSFWDFHNSTLGCEDNVPLTTMSWLTFSLVILGLSLTGAITQFTKITVGRPRPGRLFSEVGLGTLLTNFYSRRYCSMYTTDGIRRSPMGSLDSGHLHPN